MSQNVSTISISSSEPTSQINSAVTKRLRQELMNLMMSEEKSVSAFPEGEDIFKWKATIQGPEDTVYQGFLFKLSVQFPESYPYSPPSVKFVSKCFHPNVDMDGNICLDILKDKWSALYDVSSILISIQSLLAEPNNESPLNGHASRLWSDQEAFRIYLSTFSSTEHSNK